MRLSAPTTLLILCAWASAGVASSYKRLQYKHEHEHGHEHGHGHGHDYLVTHVNMDVNMDASMNASASTSMVVGAGRSLLQEGLATTALKKNGKTIAYCVTVSKDGNFMDGAAVLGWSVMRAHRFSEYDFQLVAIVHPSVTKARAKVG